MPILYIFSRPGPEVSALAASVNGSYVVKDPSARLLACADMMRAAGWRELSGPLSFDFTAELGAFLSSLNEANVSRHWWTLNFTDKNPLASAYAGHLFYFLRITEALREHGARPVAYITEDAYSIRHLGYWARESGVTVVDRSRTGLKWFIKQWTPVGPCYAFARALVRHIRDRFVLGRAGRRPGCPRREWDILCASLVNDSAFKDGRYRDLYFEPLLGSLRQEGKKYGIFALITEPYNACVDRMTRLAPHDVVTINAAASIMDLVRCLVSTVKRLYAPVRWKGQRRFRGYDIAPIIHDAIWEDLCSTKYFTNAVFYRAALRLFRLRRPKIFLYFFEMHPWEKLMLAALRRVCPGAYAVGYQHVAITPRHLNLTFTEDEAARVPFPDKIVTLGDVSRKILLARNPFLAGKVESGCALRQSGVSPAVPVMQRASGAYVIAVIMASSLAEHIGLVRLANACAAASRGSCRFLLRGHPTIDLARVIADAGGLASGCVRSESPLGELLQSAHIVMYTSSTVAIEALAAGKPVMYADTGDYISPDPLYDYNGRVFKVKDTADVMHAVEALRGMRDEEFSGMVAAGREYARDYFCAVTPERLDVFLKETR